MDNKIILSAMAMDLKRAALGLYRQSSSGTRFLEEAMKRKNEINKSILNSYMKVLINKMDTDLNNIDDFLKADKALMYSTLIQNYVLYK